MVTWEFGVEGIKKRDVMVDCFCSSSLGFSSVYMVSGRKFGQFWCIQGKTSATRATRMHTFFSLALASSLYHMQDNSTDSCGKILQENGE